ncbi:Uncharacterized protein ALO44_04811 [Pseudomonas syringae pv. tagetis]|uniref:DUF1835 domain-containing protein n=2 Tax=Pseudomonas syringae pv. tagetis TaxID=129140 RepID=A0A0Q0HGT1_9PSED|nr:Uncharacterized protein ALO44_04811 [Pseudomonas syringae pv. tagetis]RMR05753.1 hypothetical protein ALP93_04648 [Pseudomonas syringae pv. helianthi]RMW15059.1 hypothetical protein ALO98_04582 [Pseudomonas syringae pv. tagetis]
MPSLRLPTFKRTRFLQGDRMSSTDMSSSHHGRINLEQQRKRAKELLLRMKNGTAPDQLIQLGKTTPLLSDAQWLIARQLGFSSWPRLKAHVEAVDFAARHPDFDASDEVRTVHWRCGSDIAHTLKLAGFKGSFKTLTDPLCMGPVQALPAEAYQAARSQYISQAFGLGRAEVARRFDNEYADLRHMSSADHSVLWCEADAYDQLFLIRALAALEQLPPRLELIQVKQIPGVERFIGIGQLAPDLLAWLWPQRQAVTEEMLHLARQAWAAYCNPSPVALADLAHTPQPALPFLAPALLRQLQELPGVNDGLSLTERLSLQYIGESASVTFGEVFAELTNKREPLPFLGDMMFHAIMRPLIDSPTALLIESDTQLEWHRRSIRLTRLGRQVLEAEAYWPDYCHQVRWVGGVCIQVGQPHWTIDDNMRPLWRT